MISNETKTAKHQARAEHGDEIFRLLVDSVKDYAIFLLDTEGKVATWNQGAERIKGYKASEIIGEHFSRFYPTEAQETKWPDRELEMAAKEGRFSDEGLRVRKDGSTFWAHVVISALRDETGELRGFSKVTRDLTERRTLEERTRQLNRELRTRVTELLETQQQVELRTQELQKLSGELLRVQDEERRRMARTLHDDLGQELTALKLELDLQDQSGSKKGQLLAARELTASALGKVRNLSYLLHPPPLDESGLLPALNWYFEGLQSRGQVRITFDYKPIVFPRLPRDIEITVFRIIQESLTNIYRHSESQDARIELIQETDTVTLRIRDFGKGIPDHKTEFPTGVGISGMRERVKQFNGELKVSKVQPGTLVVATIPILELACNLSCESKR
ncbi:MAG: PAS domain-containing sensor histidine kinase [Candidatus Sulfotelmatobacter sp.]